MVHVTLNIEPLLKLQKNVTTEPLLKEDGKKKRLLLGACFGRAV